MRMCSVGKRRVAYNFNEFYADVNFGGAFGNQDKEACDLFDRRLAAKRQHPFAGIVQFLQRLMVQAAAEIGRGGHHPLQHAFRDDADFHVGCGLSAHAAFAGKGAAHEIRGKLQADDLLGELVAVNLPGTDRERPNWRRRLPGDIGALFDGEMARRIMAALVAQGLGSDAGVTDRARVEAFIAKAEKRP